MKNRTSQNWACLTVIGLCALSPAYAFGQSAAAGTSEVSFARQIRPILSQNCFQCHGPDAGERQADLRLDTEEGLFAIAGDKKIVNPGNVEGSELLARIVSQDADAHMPPADSGKALTAEQVELIRAWIAQGAKYQVHWAFVAPAMPVIPKLATEDPEFLTDEVDAFVLERLQTEGVAHAASADRRTLARRLTLDLTGLVPTPAEVERFVQDTSPNAYEDFVDRLLSSPRFGERMAQYWLDVVRYADTNGIHSDNHRDHYLYRDYVISAFNQNKPIDQFVIEQIAGDLVPASGQEQLLGSGFNRLLSTTEEGGAQPKEYQAKYDADRVRNTSAAFLGITLGCCQCHDHKYDPFTARDFYSLAAFFADVGEVSVGRQQPDSFPTPEQAAQLQALNESVAQLQQQLNTQTPELDTALAAWESAHRSAQSAWVVQPLLEVKSQNGTQFEMQPDHSVLAVGDAPNTDTYTLAAEGDFAGITGLRLEVQPDDRLPAKGPGRASNGNFTVNEVTVSVDGAAVAVASAAATHQQDGSSAANTIDGNPGTFWAILPKTGESSQLWLVLANPLAAGAKLEVSISQLHGDRHNLGRFQLAVTRIADPASQEFLKPIAPEVAAILDADPAARSADQQAQLAAYFRGNTALLQPVRDKISAAEAAKTALQEAMPKTLVTHAVAPRTIRILPRGNWLDESGEAVLPAVPALWRPLDKPERATRLDLARWMVHPEQPLVSRVFVNRIWKLMFGQGLVRSTDDFGAQGEVPTHPELLDYLALDFQHSGWDLKRLIRKMVCSGTYRQSSKPASPEALEKDPHNRLLARQGRFRLDAETVRDVSLTAAGLLSHRLYGPSNKPYQPAGYWDHLNFPPRTWEHDHGDNLYRRGVYTYWCRTFLHPAMVAFDAPAREECMPERPRSNTPLQALVLLNDPCYVEAARVFAGRILLEGGSSTESRLRFAFMTALSRDPHEQEVAILTALAAKHAMEYSQDLESARQLLSQSGEFPVPAGVSEAELAAWTSVARVILNLHETVNRN